MKNWTIQIKPTHPIEGERVVSDETKDAILALQEALGCELDVTFTMFPDLSEWVKPQ